MPFTETGAEKVKRKAYEKGNRERGIEQEAKRDYQMFGTTEQNIPVVNPMGDVVSGGEMARPRSRGVQSMLDALGAKGMKKGGSVSSASKRADGCAIRGKTKA